MGIGVSARVAIKDAAYSSGALGALHAARNRDVLTAVMFHRVLAPGDPRWGDADPRYTVSTELLAECLDFFARHYAIVSVADVLGASAGDAPLPARPLLVTFDDGWTDTYDSALPVLQAAGCPAVVYVVLSTIGHRRAFWQERIIGAVLRGRLSARELQMLAPDAHPVRGDLLATARAVVRALTPLHPHARARRMASFPVLLGATAYRAMADLDELVALREGGLTIGAHGVTHERLCDVADLRRELREPRTGLVAAAGWAPDTVSFPHGSVDARVVAEARAAGYRLLATSGGLLNPLRAGRPTSDIVHRVGLSAQDIAGRDGRLSAARLAAGLFRRGIGRRDLLDCGTVAA